MPKPIYIIAVIAGIATGLMSTFPVELGMIASFSFWCVAAIVLGLFTNDRRTIVISGILFGVFLSVAFLYSRFGGTADKLLAYSVFVAIMSIAGAAGGVVGVFVGSKLRTMFGRAT
jgi:hypothetical protein